MDQLIIFSDGRVYYVLFETLLVPPYFSKHCSILKQICGPFNEAFPLLNIPSIFHRHSTCLIASCICAI